MKGERYCYDINEYLIEMFKALQNGWLPPQNLTVDEYYYIKNHPNSNKALTGFAGIGCSYSGKWFGGFARNKNGRKFSFNGGEIILQDLTVHREIYT